MPDDVCVEKFLIPKVLTPLNGQGVHDDRPLPAQVRP